MVVNRFTALARTYRHVQRYREIAMVLLKHGFGDLAATLGLRRHLPFRHRRAMQAGVEEGPALPTRAERIRLALEELGPTFVKLGQFLSTRRDLLPDALIVELERLQDTVAPFPGAEARRIVERELGRPIGELFRTFSEPPLASASVAQVHEAVTLEGERVVVKVRRPGIESTVRTDLEIIQQLAGMTERLVDGAEVFEPVRIVQHFGGVLRRELDFLSEAAHVERFDRCFRGDARIHVPHIRRDLTTECVLTMEYVEGIKVSEIDALRAAGLDPETVAQHGVELMFEQVFTHGFFHADPHPGNILVQANHVICFLDYGMMGVLSRRYREQLSNLVLGLVNRDERQITSAIFRLSGYSRYERVEVIEADAADFIEQHLYRPLEDIRIGEVLNELTRMLIVHDIRMPPQFFILTKALTTIEGVGRRLSPAFDVIQHMAPLAKKLLRQRMGARRLASEFFYSALELQALIRDLPSDVAEVLRLFKRGEVRVKFEHRGLENMIHTHDQISNRMVFAIVLAALVVGSSIMVLSDIPPKWHGIPLLGVAGFLVSGLMGFSLLYSILKHGKL
ncbi:MAG: AarF/ABC1/UbiB kinase family protein [Kiritimatiellaeota bacterium]|nr:AarF/ABC1/UbiB kinase family protein [Kiritimatiellota bacterium]